MEGPTAARAVVRHVEEKRDQVLAEIKRSQVEVQLRIDTAEQILAQEPQQRGEEVLSQLKGLQKRLQEVVTDYQLLLEAFISFFKNLSELELTVLGLEGQYEAVITAKPLSLAEVEKLLKEHDASRQAILELFKFALTESQQIITKIKLQEPESAAEKDVDAVRRRLEAQRTAWERAWAQHRTALEAQQQLAQFDADLVHIHDSLDDLSHQLSKVKGQLGADLASAKATSLAFHYFEKTIQLVEERIETFMGAGDAMLKSKHSSSPHIQQELLSLRNRWHLFHQQVADTRQLIDINLEYFALVEEAEEWFREGSRLLMAIAKKSSTIRTPQEAKELLQEIEIFLKPGESKQEERIKKISELAVKLYGKHSYFGSRQPDQVQQVKAESQEMIESFSQVTVELQQIVNFLNKPPEEQQKEIIGLQAALPEDEQPSRKSPSPPLKKPKVEEETQPPNFSLPLHDATIDEGSRFTFECRVTGIPRPEVTWLKDNIGINSNLDYHTSVAEDGLCSLTIEETFTEDSACFTCRATNLLGYAETTALLTVRENERESPPVFVRLLAPGTCREGASVSLVCRVEGTPLPTVQWYKDGVSLDLAPDYTSTYNNGEAVLNVALVRLQDQGTFSCQATNRLGTETTSASLTVQPMVSEKVPVIVKPLSNVMARTGQKIRLECEVAGVPEPHITWTHNGKPLPDTRDIKLQNDGGKLVLTILEAFPKDAGTYSVTATNNAGSVTGSCSVAVKGRLPTETSDSELASDLEPTKPSIPTPLKNTLVMEGEQARLDCIIIGQPEPEVIWYHEGVPVKESKEVKLLFQGDRCYLIIAETLPDDAGQYKVVAINSAGEASSECHLTVHGSVPDVVEQPTAGLKPFFISLLTDALATEGDSVTLECAVKGDPVPNVTWSLNNNPLPATDRIKISQDPGGLCCLTISPVDAGDKGVYTARAVNPLGEAKCFAHLIVKAATNISSSTPDTDLRPEERSSIPAFTELFADRTVVEGCPTKFECIVTGKPTPKVRWLYNGEPVSGKEFLPSVSGARQVLAIPSATKALSGGKISCTAENEAGRSNCTATLTVTDAPPVDDLLSSIDKMDLSETSVFEMKREVFMQTSSLTKFGPGQEPTTQVHGIASRDEQISKKIGDKPPVQVESHKTSEYHSAGGVEERVDAESSTTGTAGAVVLARGRKQAPPRFLSPLMGKIVDQGADVVLECVLEGFPAPSVTWKKNGKELVAEDKVRLNYELNRAQCHIDGVKTEDAGQYSCVAANPVGTATCTADLVVKKHVFPPVFGRRLHADSAVRGSRVVLEVEVTGTPDPTVTWYKDGQQIAGTSSMFRVFAQGSSHRLIIEQAGLSHCGRYEVRAVNSGGEAHSSADLLIVEPPAPEQPPLHLAQTQPAELEMDIPAAVSDVSSQPIVSISESFKSDKKVSIRVEHSTAPLDFDLPPLSIKPMEPPVERFKKEFESISKQEEKEVILSTPIPELALKQVSSEQPPPTLQSEETAIEDTSISKKSALSFFKNIIKENEEEAKSARPEEPVTKPPITEKLPILQPITPPFTFHSPLSQQPLLTQTCTQQSSQTFESIYTSDGLVLQPEPPPEMGFISKSQVTKGKEDMANRVKKLEDSHRQLSQDQIPSGGIKIFPTPISKPTQCDTSSQTKPVIESPKNIQLDSVSTQTNMFNEPVKPIPVIETSNFSEETVERSFVSETPKIEPVVKPFVPFKVAKFEPVKKSEAVEQHGMISESFSSFQSSCNKTEILNGDVNIPHYDSLGPILRPSADIPLRPQSPRPSAEGVSMEKLWASKKHEEHVEFPHTFTPIETFSISSEPTQGHVEHFKSEQISSFKEIKRTSSPLPSATGLAMEKLWTPTLDHQRPLSSLSVGERPKSPSAQGLAMDKLWAHKASTQKKVWPPPNTTEESQTVPHWTYKPSEETQPLVSSDVSVQKESFSENNMKYESESFSKVESSSFQSSNISNGFYKSGSAFTEVIKPVKPYIPPVSLPPESKIIYVAETHASHSTTLPVVQPQTIVSETKFIKSSEMFEKNEKIINDSSIVEERVLRPSEAVKMWPPIAKEEPTFQKQDFQSSYTREELKKEFSSNIPFKSFANDIPLEPGPPPEIGFAEPPPRRRSYVETIEQDLEKNIDKVPSKHLAGAVRIIPPPIKKEETSLKTNTQSKTTKAVEVVEKKKPYVPECITKPLPPLEPFPFKAEPPKSKPAKCPPPPRPSKFVKGSFTESDYESDCDAVRIPVKWNPWQSDSEEYGYRYRKVKPPSAVSPTKRPHSATGRPVPPTEFEKPPPLQGPSKSVLTQQPEISKSSKCKIIKTEESYRKSFVAKETKPVQNKVSPIKPGSPPQFVEAPAPPAAKIRSVKPGSPKTRPKNVQPNPPESGYMADTDEPSRQEKVMARTEESAVTAKTEQSVPHEDLRKSRTEVKTLQTSGVKTFEKKESTRTEYLSSVQKKEEPPLEPFPFKPDPARPTKRPMGPPPPSPSKFIKGEFRESDYESEYEGKIRPLWRPTEPVDDMTFRPVRPVLTPVSGRSQNVGRTPTPPTEFEEPPNFSGPPRPKFEPIDKPKIATKVKENVVDKTKLIKPKPVQAQPPSPIPTIYATPASKPAQGFALKPGSPPRMDYAHPPGFVEKSNIVNFTESTASSKRVVSVQQTTRVMQFSSSQNHVRKENIPPSKFVPAFSKESDYDSEVDGVVSNSVRTPFIDAEKKRLKRVEEMKRRFLESEPQLQPGEPPEFVYSPDPSRVAYTAASKQMNEMTQTFKGKTQKFVSDIISDIKTTSDKSILKSPGEEPQTYRDETRHSEFGSKHIDPDTGLIYFKYDFGYEFGIVLPGEKKPGAPKRIVTGPSKREEGSIDFPVIHETTKKKAPTKPKTVKWEPTSESEMSEIESERVHRGRRAPPHLQTPSPHSRTPSVQSVSPYPPGGHEHTVSPGSPWLTTETPQIVRAVSPGDLPKKAPLFITPLRDIACVSGQPARFECIVLAEPVPSVIWSKDGQVLHPSHEHVIEYRNGVCRLVLPRAKPFDAGHYTCSASNPLGSAQTTASLQVPGERRTSFH